MTREEIIRMALEAGMSFNQSLEELNTPFCKWSAYSDDLERFAALVAAAEREECAKVCDFPIKSPYVSHYVSKIAAAIRARGNTWHLHKKPLTDEELDALAIDEDGLPNSHIEFARAIERAHGIKE